MPKKEYIKPLVLVEAPSLEAKKALLRASEIDEIEESFWVPTGKKQSEVKP